MAGTLARLLPASLILPCVFLTEISFAGGMGSGRDAAAHTAQFSQPSVLAGTHTYTLTTSQLDAIVCTKY
jgi:hypothetical protein